MPKGIQGFQKEHKINLGKKRSEEAKRNMSLAHIGKPSGRLGKKHLEETKNKMRGENNPAKRPEVREKMRLAHLGEKYSEERKRKMSEAKKGKLPKNWHPELGFKKGELNPIWQGGKSFEKYGFDWIETLKRSIRERDKYICKICKKTQIEELEQLDKKLPIHHIDYNKKNNNPNNLITLCKSCHSKTNYNRDYWTRYFKT